MSEAHFVRGALIKIAVQRNLGGFFLVESVLWDTEEFILGVENRKGCQQCLQYLFSMQSCALFVR